MYCSKDCSHWKLLNSASDDVRAKSLIVKGRFIGDPSSERDNKYGQTAQIEQENKKSPQAEVNVSYCYKYMYMFNKYFCSNNAKYFYTIIVQSNMIVLDSLILLKENFIVA